MMLMLLTNRPEDGRTDLGLCREPDNEEGTAGTEMVNRLLVRSALYISGLIPLSKRP
jgi:hypothetical protein